MPETQAELKKVLFKPLAVGSTELPNRICFMAHRTNFADQGRLTDRHVAYYQRRARGGCGLITVGELSISPNDMPYKSLIAAYTPDAVADFQKLTRAVHQYDTRIVAQLGHHGFQSSGHITRQAVWAPSAVADIAFGEVGKPMEEEEIQALLDAFARATELIRAGGFDGVQIDMGPESLLRQFLSPISNQRTDEYGGDFENRMRLPLMVVDTVRKTGGSDFTVGVQLCMDEKFWGGINVEEAARFAQRFEQTGQVDFFQTSLATYYNLYLIMASMHTPNGFTLELSGQIKQSVALPVIAGYQIDFPKMAERAVANGQADAVGFVRPLICDPDLPNKIRDDQVARIRRCARDNLGCVYRINQSKPLACVQNPLAGREDSRGEPLEDKAQKIKTVVVIGAGPAGMAAACTAAQRGHRVSVYEATDRPGGQVNLSSQAAGRSGMGQMARYLKNTLNMLEVPLHVDTVMTTEAVVAMQPDAVVVATGCTPVARPYPGEYGPPAVLTLWDVYRKTYPVGGTVLLIDEIGNHQSLATAELLADQGKKVDLVTNELFVGVGVASTGDLYFSRQRLLQKGVKFQTDLFFERIDGTRVAARNVYTNAPVVLEGYDTIVLAVEYAAEDRLYHQLKGKVPELHRVGDCVAPRGIEMAIYEGEKVGSLL